MTTEKTTEIHSGEDVLDKEIFGDIWAFIMDNYTEDDGQLTKATLAMMAVVTILKKELGISEVEVSVE